jgi:hypothetical protein
MNSLRIQQQAFGWATDLAISNVCANVNRAPVQAPSAKEIVRTAEKPTPMQQIPAGDMKQNGGQEQMMYPLIRKIYGDAFDPLSEKTKKMIEPLLLEIICLKGASRHMNVTDNAGHQNSFIWVPRLSSDKSFNNTKSWVDKALEIIESPHNGTFESAFRVANHLCRFYGDFSMSLSWLVLAICKLNDFMIFFHILPTLLPND